MSTRVTPEEYGTLELVPPVLWQGAMASALCDIEPAHGRVTEFFQTPDKRAIATCEKCAEHINRRRWGTKCSASKSATS